MWSWLILGLILILDQGTKWLITTSFHLGQSVLLLPPFVALTLVHNTGAAFGLFKGLLLLLIVLSVVVVGWVGWEFIRHPAQPALIQWGCALVGGGALGNLIDRLRCGYVIDFIDLRVWPVFNVADSAITIGVGLLLWHTCLHRQDG